MMMAGNCEAFKKEFEGTHFLILYFSLSRSSSTWFDEQVMAQQQQQQQQQ